MDFFVALQPGPEAELLDERAEDVFHLVGREASAKAVPDAAAERDPRVLARRLLEPALREEPLRLGIVVLAQMQRIAVAGDQRAGVELVGPEPIGLAHHPDDQRLERANPQRLR